MAEREDGDTGGSRWGTEGVDGEQNGLMQGFALYGF